MGDLDIHYRQLPQDLYVSLNEEYHSILIKKILEKVNYDKSDCFCIFLDCNQLHSSRLFTRKIRFTIKELRIISSFVGISNKEIETNIETLGNKEDGTKIRNPRLPFNMKDLFYVASHLMFDGSFRNKKGGYFYTYSEDLLEYHKNRLKNFGDVPLNFISKENQLYFSNTIGYIASNILDIEDFRSLKVYLSPKFKRLARDNKVLLDEFIKAMIIDEATVNDAIRIELGDNERFVMDIREIVCYCYKLNKISHRQRATNFTEGNSSWSYFKKFWNIEFSTSSFKLLYESISSLPISYKQISFEGLYRRKSRMWFKRNAKETKKLIIKSLLEKPKSILGLCIELNVGRKAITSHLNGAPTYSQSLIDNGIVTVIGERLLKKGGYAKENVYGIKDEDKAKEYII